MKYQHTMDLRAREFRYKFAPHISFHYNERLSIRQYAQQETDTHRFVAALALRQFNTRAGRAAREVVAKALAGEPCKLERWLLQDENL